MNHTGLRVMSNTNVLGGLLIQTLAHELQRETLKSLQQNTLKARDKSSLWDLKSKQEIHWVQASPLKPWMQITVEILHSPPDTRTKRAMNSRCSRGQCALAAFISYSSNGLIKHPCRRVLLCVEFDLLGTKEEQACFLLVGMVLTQKSVGGSDINLTTDFTRISLLHWKRQGQSKLFSSFQPKSMLPNKCNYTR